MKSLLHAVLSYADMLTPVWSIPAIFSAMSDCLKTTVVPLQGSFQVPVPWRLLYLLALALIRLCFIRCETPVMQDAPNYRSVKPL